MSTLKSGKNFDDSSQRLSRRESVDYPMKGNKKYIEDNISFDGKLSSTF